MIALSAAAQNLSQSKVVDGIEIDWGVFPAKDIPLPGPANEAMHGGPPPGRNEYHLTVSLRNAKTGRQIGDAQVTASMHEVGVSGPWRTMQIMRIGSTVTYGGYFWMNEQSSVPYRIQLRIALPQLGRPIITEFTHYHD